MLEWKSFIQQKEEEPLILADRSSSHQKPLFTHKMREVYFHDTEEYVDTPHG